LQTKGTKFEILKKGLGARKGDGEESGRRNHQDESVFMEEKRHVILNSKES